MQGYNPPRDHPVLCIVDSDFAVLDSLSSYLSLFDIEVRTFSTGRRLRREWPVTEPCCVICAAELVDMKGVELYNWLQRYYEIPRFALTVSAHQHRLVEEARRRGIEHFVYKPFFEPERLLRFVDQIGYTYNGA